MIASAVDHVPIVFQHWFLMDRRSCWGRYRMGPNSNNKNMRLRMAMGPGRLPQAVLVPDVAAWHQREMSIKMMQ